MITYVSFGTLPFARSNLHVLKLVDLGCTAFGSDCTALGSDYTAFICVTYVPFFRAAWAGPLERSTCQASGVRGGGDGTSGRLRYRGVAGGHSAVLGLGATLAGQSLLSSLLSMLLLSSR